MIFSRRRTLPRSTERIVPAGRIPLLGLALTVSAAGSAAAQGTNPPSPAGSGSLSAASRQAMTPLIRALERLSSQTGILVVADSSVAYERIPANAVADGPAASVPTTTAAAPSPDAEAAVEKQIKALVRTLPPGTTWGKLYLPAPAPGRTWRGDDVAAFAFAQARLFGNVGEPVTDGSIEILGKRVDKASAPPFVNTLGLQPVYLISNPKRPTLGAGMVWSPMSEERWVAMSPDERKQYGQQQAAWIASLPPEQREEMLNKIRQHDRYFENVKGPLEKILGIDL
jgi:hypothetical protein